MNAASTTLFSCLSAELGTVTLFSLKAGLRGPACAQSNTLSPPPPAPANKKKKKNQLTNLDNPKFRQTKLRFPQNQNQTQPNRN